MRRASAAAAIAFERVQLIPRRVRPLDATLAAIAEADVITMGPGSLFTSIMPNLLVQGIPAAIHRSRAIKACFVNLMSQPGETTHFTASDHIRAIHQHSRAGLLDYAVINNAPIAPAIRKRYARQQATPVENDTAAILEMGVKVMAGNLVWPGEKVRHDPGTTAAVTVKLAQEGRRRKLVRP